MKKIILVALSILSIILQYSCMPKVPTTIYSITLHKVNNTYQDSSLVANTFQDSLISIQFLPQHNQIEFTLNNISNKTLKIIWDETTFVNEFGEAGRIMHSGVKFNERNNSQPASVIPPGTKITDLVAPTDKVYMGAYGWSQDYIFNKSVNDGIIKVVMPIEIDGSIKSIYTFDFRTTHSQKDNK